LTYPCPKYTTITCGFGAYSGHTGCDFSTQGNENQKIVAAEDGTVILVKLLERSYGHYIVIRHDKTTSSGKTVYTLYAHNNDILVSEGDHVTKGQQIAKSGSTGNSTGPHCHFEVRVGGSSQSYAVNPKNYLP
jgi:murein DD-endopeptidase MepM/ murein hydrolase activator NlpD